VDRVEALGNLNKVRTYGAERAVSRMALHPSHVQARVLLGIPTHSLANLHHSRLVFVSRHGEKAGGRRNARDYGASNMSVLCDL